MHLPLNFQRGRHLQFNKGETREDTRETRRPKRDPHIGALEYVGAVGQEEGQGRCLQNSPATLVPDNAISAVLRVQPSQYNPAEGKRGRNSVGTQSSSLRTRPAWLQKWKQQWRRVCGLRLELTLSAAIRNKMAALRAWQPLPPASSHPVPATSPTQGGGALRSN